MSSATVNRCDQKLIIKKNARSTVFVTTRSKENSKLNHGETEQKKLDGIHHLYHLHVTFGHICG